MLGAGTTNGDEMETIAFVDETEALWNCNK